MRIKRLNIEVNEDLLEEAVRVLGATTYSAALNTALAEVLRVRRILNLPSFFNQGLWRGDLTKMREDRRRPVVRRERKPRSGKRASG